MVKKYLKVTFEAVFDCDDPELSDEIRGSLEQLRGYGTARAVSYEMLIGDEEHQKWYKNGKMIHEITIPMPTTISIDY